MSGSCKLLLWYVTVCSGPFFSFYVIISNRAYYICVQLYILYIHVYILLPIYLNIYIYTYIYNTSINITHISSLRFKGVGWHPPFCIINHGSSRVPYKMHRKTKIELYKIGFRLFTKRPGKNLHFSKTCFWIISKSFCKDFFW